MQCTTLEIHSPHAKFRDEGPQWYDGSNADTASSEPYFRSYLYGSWDDWEEGICLSMQTFLSPFSTCLLKLVATSYNLRGSYLMVDYVPAVLTLSPGNYQYKFKYVWSDGKEAWKCDPDEPQVTDEQGNVNNLLEVSSFSSNDFIHAQI